MITEDNEFERIEREQQYRQFDKYGYKLNKGEKMSDLPNFAAWERQTLDRFALDAYLRLQAQQEALEQLRQDLRDAMKLLRGSAL